MPIVASIPCRLGPWEVQPGHLGAVALLGHVIGVAG